MDVTKLNKLSVLATEANQHRKPKILINPKDINRIVGQSSHDDVDFNIEIDLDEWEIPKHLVEYVNGLIDDETLNLEEKIIQYYVKLCQEYVYDDNVLSYIKKYDEDQFGLPEFYGRDIDFSWKEKRESHNRRNCFELSRSLAAGVKNIVKAEGENRTTEICILWDEAITHYNVGMISDDYCVILDLDDFEEIKDLTREKTGLTLKGIKTLEDKYGKMSNLVNNYNKERNPSSVKNIINRSTGKNNSVDNKKTRKGSIDYKDEKLPEHLDFLLEAIKILKGELNLDSAGIFEYMKEIVDTKIGPVNRKKIWKEVENGPGVGKRFTRCLAITLDDAHTYIVDVTSDSYEDMIKKIDNESIIVDSPSDGTNGMYFKKMNRDWNDKYDGR